MTRDERRFDALRKLGCIACLIGLDRYSQPDIHHIVDNGYRKHSGGNQATIPLCPYHHRGIPAEGCDYRYMREIYGPSLRLESREFHRIYGTERYLLGYVNQLLAPKMPNIPECVEDVPR